MQEKRISLFDNSLQDNDVIAFGDIVYKLGKIRSVFGDVFKSTYGDLAAHLKQQQAHKLGLCYNDGSIGELYSDTYCGFEYLNLGSSNWETGRFRIYLSPFFYNNQSDLKEDIEAGCYYPNLSFNDIDVISLREDCFCMMQPIKNVFKSISSSFGRAVARELEKSIVDFGGSNLLVSGKGCGLLRLGDTNWETVIIGVKFTIDAVADNPPTEKAILSNEPVSPLDEIRNMSVLLQY